MINREFRSMFQLIILNILRNTFKKFGREYFKKG